MTITVEDVQGALRTFQRGDVTLALESLMGLHIQHPEDLEVRYYLAVVATAAREFDLAEKQLVAVRDVRGESASLAFALGQVYWGRRELDQAAEQLSTALELQEAYPEAHALLGAVRLSQADMPAAEQALRRALHYQPDLGAARTNLANVLIARRDYDGAEALLREALQNDPDAEQAYANYLSLMNKVGTVDKAAEMFDELAGEHPGLGRPVAYQAQIAYQRGERERAVSLYEKSLALDGTRVVTHAQLAILLMEDGRISECIPVLQTAIDRFPKDPALNGMMGAALDQVGRRTQSRAYFQRALQSDPDSIHARSMLIPHLIGEGDLDGAEALIEEIEALDPSYTVANVHRANIRDRQGKVEEAAELLESLMDRGDMGSEVISAYLGLRHRDASRTERAVQEAKRFLDDVEQDQNRRTIRFALGKTLERMGQYPEAFREIQAANDEKPGSYDAAATAESFASLKRVFSRDFQQAYPVASTSGEPVVFVVGMPRSGTTLTEQILASHSQMTGAGELLVIPDLVRLLPQALGGGLIYPDFVRHLDAEQMTDIGAEYLDAATEQAGGASRFTDKLPQNFLNLGFIDRILPGSKIIHCRRNPMDTCMSIYGIDFFGAHPYAYSQQDLGHYYTLYLNLMAHWREIGVQMHEVCYEQTVADLEGTARGMLEFLGLDWEDGLLDFHQTGRSVSTASFQQVRRPLYKSSVERWRRYEDELQPLYEILRDPTEDYMQQLRIE